MPESDSTEVVSNMSAASVVPAPSSEKAVAKVKIDLKTSRLSLSKPPSVTFDPMAVNETNNQPVINLNNNNEIDAKKAVTEKVGNQLVPAALVHQQPSIANQERVPTPSRNNEVTSSGGSVPKDLTQVFFRLILLKHVKKSRTFRTYVVTHFRQFIGVPLCYSSVFRHLQFCYCATIML